MRTKLFACDPFLTYGYPCWLFNGAGFSYVFLTDGMNWWEHNRKVFNELS